MIEAKQLQIKYEKHEVVSDFSFAVQEGEILSILGPNGSGKSTILNAIAKLIAHQQGAVFLENQDMSRMGVKDIAKKLSMLSQVNQSPEDFTVRDLIYYGRLPHKKWYEQRNERDETVIDWALQETHLSQFAEKRVSALSGGERQRVWIALALAQEPKVLMLDEPTTYLDICHQIEVMDLLCSLNQKLGLTIVMVLHDLAQAARYSHRVVVLQGGAMVAHGKPAKVLTRELIREVYQVDAYITTDENLGGFAIFPVKSCKSSISSGEQKEAIHA